MDGNFNMGMLTGNVGVGGGGGIDHSGGASGAGKKAVHVKVSAESFLYSIVRTPMAPTR